MILRAACLFLFACASLTLTGCQNMGQMANPLDGANRMIQAMGRSVGRLSADAKAEPLRLDAGEIERAREAELQRGALPENAPVPPAEASTDHVAFVR
ncbi:hypothetical protein DES53_109164 [Roseimicrobium gellanilyticum]|uniref:Lipoprotein n=1 Tax=Roseimicrobium gellanilyticum TaxID=748857 RepID=A0A366HBT7_9BACT|nr:hypothetical protein [Roseimicrobium gellanilyticum]RBP39737.1 hypothetical protein DES53_109164 [Roseimicrobium gellanilyticum]